jgi:GTP cyclohydrolase I
VATTSSRNLYFSVIKVIFFSIIGDNKIKEIAETEDVYVGLLGLSHGCEVTRGAKQHSTTTTEDYSGLFENIDLRN